MRRRKSDKRSDQRHRAAVRTRTARARHVASLGEPDEPIHPVERQVPVDAPHAGVALDILPARHILRDAIARFDPERRRRATRHLGSETGELSRAVAARNLVTGGIRGTRIEVLAECLPASEHTDALDEIELTRGELS